MSYIYKGVVIFLCLLFDVSIKAAAANTAILINTTNATEPEYRKIIWDECKKMVVADTYTTWSYRWPLHPLADEALRHVSFRSASGRTEYIHMRFGLQASYNADIMLSPDPEGTDFHFQIRIKETSVELGETKHHFYGLKNVDIITNLSVEQPTALHLRIIDDKLELRREHNSAPFLEYRDDRFRDVKYFGFDSCCNYSSNATVYYDC